MKRAGGSDTPDLRVYLLSAGVRLLVHDRRELPPLGCWYPFASGYGRPDGRTLAPLPTQVPTQMIEVVHIFNSHSDPARRLVRPPWPTIPGLTGVLGMAIALLQEAKARSRPPHETDWNL